VFSCHTLLIFLDVPPVRLQKIIFVWQKNPSPLVIPPMFKQALIPDEMCTFVTRHKALQQQDSGDE